MSKVKKLSRKDVGEMSTTELWSHAKEALKKMRAYLRPYRVRFVIGVLFGIFAGLFNLVLIFGLNVIFSIVLPGSTNQAQSVTLPGIGTVHPMQWLGLVDESVAAAVEHDPSQPFVNVPVEDHSSLALVIIACAMVPLLILIRGLFTYLGNYCMMWVGNKMLHQMRNDVFRVLLSQSLGFYNRSKIGDLIQVVFNQSRVAQTNAVMLAQVLISRPVAILTILGALFYLYPVFTLASLVVFPLCILPVSYIGKRVRNAGAREEAEAGAMMVTMHETFAGIRVVKANSRESFEAKKFDRSNTAMQESIMRWGKALEIVGPIVETVASLGIAAGLVYAWHENMTANDFFVVVMALTQIYPPAKDLSRVQILLQKCIVATTSVFAMLETEPDVKDKPDAQPLKKCKGGVGFSDLTFHYRDAKGRRADHPAVENIDLVLEPGRFYALVGPSGAGKSTLFSLLLRFYDPEQGRVEIDGHDIRDFTQESLRAHIGVVSQDTFLFHDTVMENIRYGRLDATDEEVIAAAKKAHAHEFIMQIKDGYEALVGDSGCNLSGGQRQRVSIARAVLRDAPILLLDEATSALDAESEKIIKEAIHTLSEGKTVIAIAHRLSTILEADQIVVMSHGHVEDVGTHQELLQKNQLYQRLYHLQSEAEEIGVEIAS